MYKDPFKISLKQTGVYHKNMEKNPVEELRDLVQGILPSALINSLIFSCELPDPDDKNPSYLLMKTFLSDVNSLHMTLA